MQAASLSAGQHKDWCTQGTSCGAPISKLPNDLLHDLFVLLAESCPLRLWIPVTLVCRTWKEVAVGTPSLWKEPPTHHHDLTLLMLERAQMVDLTISLGGKTSAATTEAIMGHVGRIRSLSIMQPPSLLARSCTILQKFAHQALRLEDIAIKCTMDPADLGSDVSVSSMSFCQLPRLRKIDFCNIISSWNTLLSSSITDLALIEARGLSEKIPIALFLEGLAQLPHLETLEFDSHIFPDSEVFPPASGLKNITLPNLVFADIQCVSMPQLAAILSHMTLPRLRNLRTYLWQHGHSAPWMRPLLSTIARGNFGLGSSNTLVVRDRGRQLIWPHEKRIKSSPGLHLVLIGVVGDGYLVRAILKKLDDQVGLRITELTLDGRFSDDGRLSDKMVQLVVNRLPHLKSISLRNIHIPTLIEMLSRPPENNPFPNLANITLCQRAVLPGGERDQCSALLRSLRRRHSAGIPIHSLSIPAKSAGPDNYVVSVLNELGVELKRVAMMKE